MKIYIASKFENAPAVQRLRDSLIKAGHQITYDWTLTKKWRDVEHVREVAELEMQGVLAADLLIVMLPGGIGTHTELGMAIAHRKRILIVTQWAVEITFDWKMYPFYEFDWIERLTCRDESPEVAIPRYIAETPGKRAA